MNREQEKRRLRAGAFMVNNGRVLMTINLLREKYNALRSVEKGLKAEGIERQEFIDSVNFLHEEGYIYLRDMESREPANLADVEYQTLEAKVTGKGIRLLGGGITGKVDRLPPELKDTVEQMLLTGCTYKEIVAFLKANGEEMSQMAICTYARKYLATVEMINVAQSNFSMLMDEMNRYPDLDTSEALIRLASHHVLNALTNVDEEQMKEVPIEKLIKETNGLIRAAAYKKRIEVQNKENYEAGLEAVQSMVFETMAKDNPELYRQVSAYLNKKKSEGMEG